MMIPERPVARAPRARGARRFGRAPPRIPVVLGGCGTGRTSLLLRLRDLIGRTSRQYVDVERVATTPERFLTTLRDDSPFPPPTAEPRRRGRRARGVRRHARVSRHARAPAGDGPATFLLDEFLELRTFESFPGLRTVLRDLLDRAGLERQPLRADDPLHGPRAPPAARRAGAVRNHPRHAADARRDSRDAAARSTRPGRMPSARLRTNAPATISRGWSTRSPTGVRPTRG